MKNNRNKRYLRHLLKKEKIIKERNNRSYWERVIFLVIKKIILLATSLLHSFFMLVYKNLARIVVRVKSIPEEAEGIREK